MQKLITEYKNQLNPKVVYIHVSKQKYFTSFKKRKRERKAKHRETK